MEKGSEVAVSRNSLSLSLSHCGEFCHREVGKGGNFVTCRREKEGILSAKGMRGKGFCHLEEGKGRNFVTQRQERVGIRSPRHWLCPALT